ncbi:MAG: Fic family protein [Desulfobacteraceae bacterium]|nr:MAG: Fic family protein [Desulfobacteraceae bacterium]
MSPILLSLVPRKLVKASIPVGTSWLLGSCMEARGKQDLWLRQKPELLEVLREQAIIQSVESSNRIEGVTIPTERLRPVVLGKEKPRDRSEEELAGYRQALDWIFSRKLRVSIVPTLIQRIHAMSQRFVPTSARDTPKTMEALCRNYREACNEERIPPLLIVATFVFDLLCIHPFRDGNGRVSRLTTTLLLQAHGFLVSRYVSLERLIEHNKDEYYDVLAECSRGWHEGKSELVPWWTFFLSILRRAYKEFERQVESVAARPAKSDLIRKNVLGQVQQFTLGDLASQMPAASTQLIKKVLGELKKQGRVRLVGRGRGARWEIIPQEK